MTEDLRGALINRLLRMVALGGAAAYVPSVWLAAKHQLWWVAAADTLALGLVVALALLPRLPSGLKVASVLVISYGLGLGLIVWTGPTGAGHLFLFTFVFLAVLFGGRRGMVWANGLGIATHAALVTASASGVLNWEQTFDSVLIISVNYVLVSLLLTAAVQFLLGGYHRALEEERRSREVTEVLLQEIEHRAKNNLQVISSLITLRSRRNEGAEQALNQIRESLSAMAAVQQLLFRQEDEYLVRLPEMLQSLVERFRTLYRPVEFDSSWTGPEAIARSDLGVSLGLLLNEIVTNSVRHAFADPAAGRVFIDARYDQENEVLTLVVADSGRGRAGAPDGTGSRIIRALAQQISARMTLESGPGTRYRLELPVLKGGTP